MLIKHIGIKGFRSLEEVEFTAEKYTALIGANGAGKSSVLYALDWFFNNRKLFQGDYYKNNTSGEVKVTLSFEKFSLLEMEELGKYIFNDLLTLRRSSLTSKMELGIPKINEDLVECWNKAHTQAGKTLYNKICKTEEINGLPPLKNITNFQEIQQNILRFSTKNFKQQLSFVSADFLSEKIKDFITYVLIPAEITNADLDPAKTSASSTLLSLLDKQILQSNSSLRETEDLVKRFSSATKKQYTSSTIEKNELVKVALQTELAKLLPSNLTINVDSMVDYKAPSTVWSFSIGADSLAINQQGHGVQRAILIAFLRASKFSSNSTTIIAIEEPEIYQHPVRARHFAKTLLDWSEDSINQQIIIATHSPYFILPSKFESVRLFRLAAGKTEISSTSIKEVSIASKLSEEVVLKFLTKEIPKNFSEAFFSEGVVLVEGDTDIAILEGFDRQCEFSFSSLGISIISVGGKTNLNIPQKILKALNIPTYLMVDADMQKENKYSKKKSCPHCEERTLQKYSIDIEKESDKLATVLNSLNIEKNFKWGDESKIDATWCIFKVDIEEELSKIRDFYKIWNFNKNDDDIINIKKGLQSIKDRLYYHGQNLDIENKEKHLTSLIEEINNKKYNEEEFATELRKCKDALKYQNVASYVALSDSSFFLSLIFSMKKIIN